MSQDVLFLLVLAISGLYSSRWMMRLAPARSELPLKTIAATAVAAVAFLLSLTTPLAPALLWIALLLSGVFVLGPLAATALARAGWYGAARQLSYALYWTEAGRRGIGRLLAQVALHKGDAAASLLFLPEDAEGNVLRSQAYALQERWQELLELPLPPEGDNRFLAMASRAQAYLQLGEIATAEHTLEHMQQQWQAQGQGPLGYRSIQLTQARLHAARGQASETQRILQQPLPGVPAYLVAAILAEAAERGHQLEAAIGLYRQAYQLAPAALRPRYAAKVQHYGQPLPSLARQGVGLYSATLWLIVVLGLSYALQMFIDQRYGQRVASLSAGFLLNTRIPEESAWWRYMSYAFVHGNLLHIALNCWVLFDIGRLYEGRRHWGSLLMAFAFGTGMGAYLTAIAQATDQLILVGASGGVLGIAGALLADTLRSRKQQDRLLTRALLQWIALIIGFSLLVPEVSLWGHLGGIVGGLLWGFMRQGLPAQVRFDRLAAAISVSAMASSLLFVAQWFLRYRSMF